MSSPLLLPKVHAPAALMTMRAAACILAPFDEAAHGAGEGLGSITVASLRAARKLHLVRLSDPATNVVTDFAATNTVADDAPVDDVLSDMFRLGVHVLVVQRDATISGLVSSEDIQGGRMQQFLGAHPDLRREDVRAGDILTPCEELPAVDTETIRCARVGDLVRLFEAMPCSHILVLERDCAGSLVLRGHIARTRLERQLEPRL